VAAGRLASPPRADGSPAPKAGKKTFFRVEHKGRVMCLMFTETHLLLSYGSNPPTTADAIAAATHVATSDIIGADVSGEHLFRLRIWRNSNRGREETAIEMHALYPPNPQRFLNALADRVQK
jgi:hypothetical protein